MKTYKSRLKLHIDRKHFRLMLVGIALFVGISTIFLAVYFRTNSEALISAMVSEHKMPRSKAILLLNVTHFGTFALDWVVAVTFLYSAALGLKRVEYGNGFLYSWMIGWTALGLLPFSFAINNNIALIKTIVLLIPTTAIFVALLLQTNDLKWYRKNDVIRKTRERVV